MTWVKKWNLNCVLDMTSEEYTFIRTEQQELTSSPQPETTALQLKVAKIISALTSNNTISQN